MRGSLRYKGPDPAAKMKIPVSMDDVLAATANDDLRLYIISPGGGGSWDCDISADDVGRLFMLDQR